MARLLVSAIVWLGNTAVERVGLLVEECALYTVQVVRPATMKYAFSSSDLTAASLRMRPN